MTLSTPTIETLIDLVEIKLSCFEVWDREDKRELKALQSARDELHQVRAGAKRPGRRPRAVPEPAGARVAVG